MLWCGVRLNVVIKAMVLLNNNIYLLLERAKTDDGRTAKDPMNQFGRLVTPEFTTPQMILLFALFLHENLRWQRYLPVVPL